MAITKVTKDIISDTLDLSGKTVTLPSASVTSHVTAYDDDGLQNDIAILGFKVAANGSLAKYNLVDQTIDAFEDASGIDASASTNEVRSTSNYYYGGASTWETGDRSSTIDVTSDGNTFYEPASARTGASGVMQQLVNGDFTNDTTNSLQFWPNQGVANRDLRFDLGSAKVVTDAKWYQSGTSSNGVWKWQASNDNWSTTATIGGNFTLGGATEQTYSSQLGSNTTAYRYWKYRGVSGNMVQTDWMEEIEFKVFGGGTDLTLISNATTAEAAPTKGDLVMTYTNGAGTASIGDGTNGDIRAFVSRDDGTTYTQFTLADEGDTGGHTILTAHDLDISAQPSGTSMRYKITTHDQSASKETRIQAVSLGWS